MFLADINRVYGVIYTPLNLTNVRLKQCVNLELTYNELIYIHLNTTNQQAKPLSLIKVSLVIIFKYKI